MALKKDRTLAELADVARLVVRSAYLNPARVLEEVSNFVRAELDDEAEAYRISEQLVAEADAELAADQQDWPDRTDNDAMAEVLAELPQRGWLVLEYCEDHFDATRELKAHPGSTGIVFFTETDVWHAITEKMLELKVWLPDTSNVVSADPELAMVLDLLTQHGLPAIFDEGRVEVSFTWQRRPQS